ncbi:hypothetical protein ACFQY4_06280 [Catellatospora bangladeshensis]|uniref:hypothetical protein n=1 Tax=Catellatospora bangladeshensis TaxID=310355 RepID=UPI003622B2DF
MSTAKRAGLIAVAVCLMAGVGAIVLVPDRVRNPADFRQTAPEPSPAADRIEVGHLRVGDCVERIVHTGDRTVLPMVPCTQPHEFEIVGTFRPVGDFPGEGWRRRGTMSAARRGSGDTRPGTRTTRLSTSRSSC